MILLLLFIKHFICDFPLQAQWIVAGKGLPKGWIFPLEVHCLIHSVFTFWIIFFYAPFSVALSAALFDHALHFLIDRIKAHPQIGGRWKIHEKGFWNALGLDQLAHQLTYLAIYFFVTGANQ